MLKKIILLILLFGGIISQTWAQGQIKGKVIASNDNEGIPGVTVMVKGTSTGTMTNVDGEYVLSNVGSNAIITFSAVGFISKEESVNGRSIMNVTLQPDEKQLAEVIVVGYGTVSADKHVGASVQINAKDISNRPNTNALNAVIGAAPGVQATVSGGLPGSAPSIRVRGFGSINASNDALYVVDGVPYTGGSSNINPEDIESISVLKDASTTAIYGSRGANGVVIITTKKGKEGKSNLNFHGSLGTISRGLPEYETVDAYQYYPLQWEAYRNALHYGNQIPMDIASQIASGKLTSYNGANYSSIYNNLNYNPFNVANNDIVGVDGKLNPNAKLLYPEDLDWAKAIQQGGKSRQNYNITYDGGTSKNNFFASFGYTKDEGFLLKSSLERYTARVNANSQATQWLKVGINLSGTHRLGNGTTTFGNSSYVNPFYFSRFAGPIYPVHAHDPQTGAYLLDENGKKIYDNGDKRVFSQGRHSIWENELNEYVRVQSALGARTFASITLLPNLTATTNLTFDYQTANEKEFNNKIIGDGAPSGRAYNEFNSTQGLTWNQILEYTRDFGKHNFNLLGGHESYAYKYNYFRGGRIGQVIDGNIELVNFSEVSTLNAYINDHTIESYFSRLNWDFDGKYMASASLRRDGNSRFAKDVRWANFWSLGGAYNIAKEDFFNVSWVDLLKVRSSYGLVGNDDGIGYYPYHSLYTLGRNNAGVPGFTHANIANEKLTWETGKNFDIGVDFSIFKRKLGGSVEFFNRVTDGLIFGVPVSFQNGSSTTDTGFEILTNIGSLYNRGVELHLTSELVKTNVFNYNVTLNATTFKNQITKMPQGQPLIQSGTKAYSVGHSIYDFYLREYAGVDRETGEALYKTDRITSNTKIINGDTLTPIVAEANYRYTGHSSIPDVYGSMRHALSYKGFTLDILFTYQLGGKFYDAAYADLMHSGKYGTAMHKDILNRWTPENKDSNIPRLDNAQVTNFGAASSTRWLVDASYLQLNNVTLGYNFNKSITEKLKVKNLNVYVSGENLFLLSARKGLDVTGSFNGTVANTYTFNKIFTGGVKVAF